MYTFSFPYFNQKPEVKNGMVVSLDENGYVFTGAGTTISQNVTRSEIRYGQDVDDIRVCAWDENIVFTGSKGMLVAFEISYDDIPIDNPSFTLPQVNGKSRNVESLYRIGDSTLAVVGSGQILPVTVKVTDTSGGKQMSFHIDFEAKAENAFTFAEDGDNAYPHCDDLKDSNRKDMIACTFERDHMLVTTVFTLQSDGKFVRTNEVEYAKQRQYHGLAGCGPEGYLVAAVGSDWDDTEHGGIGPISVAYVAIRDGSIHVGEFRNMTFQSSIGFFSLDNVMQNGAVMCYTRLASGGIDCVNLDVTYGPQGGVMFASTVRLSTGGSAIEESRTKMTIINRRTFAVMYATQNLGGALSLQMVTFNDAGDMRLNGPTYIVSQMNRWQRVTQHVVGVSQVDNYKTAIVELCVGNRESKAYLHTLYVYPRPIGVAVKSFAGGNQVQFGGLWKPNTESRRGGKLLPGFMYYTNDRGMIITGFSPAGYAHRAFGTFYITSRSDESILSTYNQVGIAVSETELMLKFA